MKRNQVKVTVYTVDLDAGKTLVSSRTINEVSVAGVKQKIVQMRVEG